MKKLTFLIFINALSLHTLHSQNLKQHCYNEKEFINEYIETIKTYDVDRNYQLVNIDTLLSILKLASDLDSSGGKKAYETISKHPNEYGEMIKAEFKKFLIDVIKELGKNIKEIELVSYSSKYTQELTPFSKGHTLKIIIKVPDKKYTFRIEVTEHRGCYYLTEPTDTILILVLD